MSVTNLQTGIVAVDGAMTISGEGSQSFTGGEIVTVGGVTWTGNGTVSTGNGAVWRNVAGSTFDAQGDGTFAYIGGAIPKFENDGTFVKSGGSGTGATTFDTESFVNTGTLNIQVGILSLLLNSVFTQTASGTLDINIGGVTPGTQFNQVSVEGQANLDGTLNVSLTNGFVPRNPDYFQVLTYDFAVGQFATINGLNAGLGASGSLLVPQYYPAQSPSPGSLTLLAEFTPVQIRTAYGVNSLSVNGLGQTIAIVVAYDDPNLFQDVDAFDQEFGIQTNGPTLFAQYGAAASFLTVVNQDGGSSLPAPDQTGDWEGEEAMDVEWAHAIAPGARIVVVETNDQNGLLAGAALAGSLLNVCAVSMSWGAFGPGGDSEIPNEVSYDSEFLTPAGHPGVTWIAASGDHGSNKFGYPAASPNVLTVGGTTLTLNQDNSIESETAWSGSGGGSSLYEPQPVYQMSTVNGVANRTIPDVAFDADPTTGVAEFDSFGHAANDPTSWTMGDGTSLGAPCWAGLIALADELRSMKARKQTTLDGATQTLPGLYSLYSQTPGDFHDITSGSNGAYSAGPGYDMVTGLGSPVANLLVPALAFGATTTTLAPTHPAVAGHKITFTATVTQLGPAAPTGMVNFVNTTTHTDLGQAQLVHGIAKLQTSALAVGSHVILAYYEGQAPLLASSGSQVQVVTPAPHENKAGDASKNYGQDLTIAGTQSATSSLVNGDTPDSFATEGRTPASVGTAPASSHAGNDTIWVGGAIDLDDATTFASGTPTISPAPPTVTDDNQSMIYGGELPPRTVTDDGLVGGDTPDAFAAEGNASPSVGTLPSNSDAGTYDITASGGPSTRIPRRRPSSPWTILRSRG